MIVREVYIDPAYRGDKLIAYFVRYVSRRKYQHHAAAQFDANLGIDYARQWIREQPNLKERNGRKGGRKPKQQKETKCNE